MMTKTRTSEKLKSAYLLLIPVLCLLLVAFSGRQVAFTPEIVVDNDKPVIKELDAAIDDIKPVIMEFGLQAGDNKPSMAPVQMTKAKISATYGDRIHPVTGEKKLHTGIDFQLAEGEIVMTTANGTVVESKNDSLRGNYVVVKHDEVYTTSYFHMKSALVKAGDPVKQGQKIGYVGSSGLSKDPHLHYEVIKNGKQVDPKDYLPEK
jgi:murein DD-endopeptidase MepM/ murein hydrolase activator NlpD